MAHTDTSARELADPYCIDDARAGELLAGASWRRLVVLGDSVAEGLGEPVEGYRPRPWADRVADALERQVPSLAYLNLGKRDLVAADVRAQQLGRALDFRPDLAIVVCGGNDILRRSFDFDAVEAELARMVNALQECECLVTTMGMFDIGHSPFVPADRRRVLGDRLHLLSERTRTVAMRHGALYVDLTSHPSARQAIWSTDGRHVNGRGHAIAATETIRCLGAHLGNAGR